MRAARRNAAQRARPSSGTRPRNSVESSRRRTLDGLLSRTRDRSVTFYTIGYGGRRPEEFLELLVGHRVRAVADVRIRPDRASMGAYARAKSPDKGIEKLLGDRGIAYHSILELGNLFRDLEDWHAPYRALFERAGELLIGRLDKLPQPFCLMCAEKNVAECHRLVIADFLVAKRGWTVEHIE
jgi:uncharacterized protein (DUF488 family)